MMICVANEIFYDDFFFFTYCVEKKTNIFSIFGTST